MKILTFSTLYPNVCQPRHGIFVEQRLGKLVNSGQVSAQVLAPVPWFPLRGKYFGLYGTIASVPVREQRDNLQVLHPRYISIPKIGMSIAPLLLARAMRPVVSRIISEGYDFDLIDAHYYYPDGVAAMMLGREYRKPVVVTARGSDINVFLDYKVPAMWIRWAAMHVNATIAVSSALKDRLVANNVPEDRIVVLRNGVDLEVFSPLDRGLIRKKYGINGRMLLSVGNLIESKGHHIAIEAVARTEDACLTIIGEGAMRKSLAHLAESLGAGNRVTFINNMPQERLKEYYCAADALMLISAREGMPNVLLESMACGTPVIATKVGGVPEIVCGPDAGVVVNDRSVDAVVQAINKLFSRKTDRSAVRSYAEKFSWDDTTHGQLKLFKCVIENAENE